MQINIEKRDVAVAGIVLMVVLLFGLLLWFFSYRSNTEAELETQVLAMDDTVLEAKVNELLAKKIENGEIECIVAVRNEDVTAEVLPAEEVIVSVKPVASSDVDPLDDTIYNNGTGAHYQASIADKVTKYEAGIIAKYGSLDEYNPDLDPQHPLYNPDIIDYEDN